MDTTTLRFISYPSRAEELYVIEVEKDSDSFPLHPMVGESVMFPKDEQVYKVRDILIVYFQSGECEERIFIEEIESPTVK